ncbi:recombinase family protein [Anaerotruncus sp. DFI.9.16]|uniref:recombinase family protein n=1 Tax=Anaerotruncus sp. DFI.9.16 TaxID=2965275 RepID=UPI002109FDC2|nr:recombinase family protein [Anaerotruncus sp. DFI.9.16]
MKFFIYSRKSVYTGKGESIENQIEMCKQYIHMNFDGVAEDDITVYEDEGFSGKNIDRPQFQKMLVDIRKKKCGALVCYRLDRISRSVSDFAPLIEELNGLGVSFICIKEKFDTSTPMGKAMMYIASVFAQLERETIAERVRDNMLMLARTGRWLGGTPPTGFTSEKVEKVVVDGNIEGRKKSACKLKTRPDEIAVVKVIYEKYLETHSVSAVSKHLIRQGVKARSGKWYSLPGIKDILQNPVYCIADKDARDYFIEKGSDVCFEESECSGKNGLLSYNKRDYKLKSAARLPIEKWIIAIGKHRGTMPGKKWVAVQRILEADRPDGKRPSKLHNDYSLLSGLIFCGKCGERMFAKTRSNGSAQFDYMCNGKLRGGAEVCDCQNLGGQQADDIVCEYLMEYANESSDIYKLLEKLKEELQGEQRKDPLAIVDENIKKCNDEIDGLVSSMTKTKIGPAFMKHVNARIEELESEITELTAERNRLQKDISIITDKQIQLDLLASALASLKDNFKNLSIHERRTLIRLMVKKIVWDGKDLHIFMDGE